MKKIDLIIFNFNKYINYYTIYFTGIGIKDWPTIAPDIEPPIAVPAFKAIFPIY